MERNEGVQCPKDLSKLALRHDVQLQHGLIVHLGAKVRKEYKCTAERNVGNWHLEVKWHFVTHSTCTSRTEWQWCWWLGKKKAPSWPDWGHRWVVSLPESAHKSPAGEFEHVKNTKRGCKHACNLMWNTHTGSFFWVFFYSWLFNWGSWACSASSHPLS